MWLPGVRPRVIVTGSSDPARDFGEPAEFHYVDLDTPAHRRASVGVGSAWTIQVAEGQERYALKMLMVRSTSDVRDLWLVRVTEEGSEEEVVHLGGEAAARFVGVIRNEAFAPADGSSAAALPTKVLADGHMLAAAYEQAPEALRLLIERDTAADDVVAAAHRREVVAEFRRMMEDDAYFDELVEQRKGKSEEGVWQDFFEANPWLLGLGLSIQLLIGWDEQKLEKYVAGASIGGPGKRADAVLTTAGLVGLLALAEIKHHRTDLLTKGDYRSGCWPPSKELAGAVAQSQGTVQLAIEQLGVKVERTDVEGFSDPAESAYLYRPRSYVVAGRLAEFVDPATGGRNEGMIRSFELYRRNLQDPVVLTFDELLARAEALVATLPELA